MAWYAVMTRARAEWMVHKRLREQGFETLHLHYRGTISHARRKIAVLKPYFPRYMFVAIGPGQAFGIVNRTDGVSTIVCTTDGPLDIPDDVIAELASRGDADGLVAPPAGEGPRERMKAGVMVRVAGGPLEGLLAQVALDDGEQIRVWLNMFGGKVEAVLDPEGAKPVSPEGPPIQFPTIEWRGKRRR